ncbi:MAG: hypothetical protein F6K58_22090 [Symploca sp. SIO2E9]|nr:hypothetical protein [Symploca sp. SIO2E9]
MSTNYPIIETQLRLIRALQKGYVEALEAGDWQAADYRCSHLNKLCEGLNHLSQLLPRENILPEVIAPRNVRNANGWVSTIRSHNSNHALTQSSDNGDKPSNSASLPSETTRNEWGNGFPMDQPPIDEVW